MPVEATKYDFVDNVFPYTYPSEGNVNLTGESAGVNRFNIKEIVHYLFYSSKFISK